MTNAKAEAPSVKGTFFTLQRKILFFIIASIGLSVGAGIYSGLGAIEKKAQAALATKGFVVAKLLSASSAGAVRFGKADTLQRSFDDVLEGSPDTIRRIAAYSASGELIIARPEGSGTNGPSTELAAQAIREGTTIRSSTESLVAAPVRFGPNAATVGALTVILSDERELQALNEAATWQVTVGATVGLIASALAYLFLRATMFRPLKQLSTSVGRLVAGERVDLPSAERRDELGDLARALAAIRGQADRANRIKAGLDNSSAAVTLTDTDFNIIYANTAMDEVMSKMESYWQSRIPGFAADSLVGRNIDVFDKDPSHQRSMLQSLTSNHNTQLRVDGRSLELEVVPVIDPGGERIGYMVQWFDRTEERAAEDQIGAMIEAASNGDFSARVDFETKDRFLNLVSDGMNRVSADVATFLDDVERVLTSMARGDLSVRISRSYPGQLGEISGQVEETLNELDRLVSMVKARAEEIKGASGEIGSGASELSSRAEAQAAAIEQTSAAMQQISTTVKENAQSAGAANDLASEATGQAERGREVVASTVSAMSDIRESARKINEILSVIDAIASQTNLLALNAAVEAARAGEAGKGFAVVASEVGRLAQRSSEAAKNIKELIEQSSQHVAQGDRLVEATDTALSEILDGVRSAAETISTIAQASREQANGVEEINGAIGEMDQMTQQYASLAEASSTAAIELSERSDELIELVRTFKTRSGEDRGGASKTPKPAAAAPRPKPQIDDFDDEDAADAALLSGQARPLSALSR